MLFFKPQTVYIRLYENRVIIRNIELDKTIDRISVNKFSNPRMVLADFINAETFIRELLKEMNQHKKFGPPIKVLIQPMEKVEGGISPVEERSYMDLALHIGGKYAYIHKTQEILSDDQVKVLTK